MTLIAGAFIFPLTLGPSSLRGSLPKSLEIIAPVKIQNHQHNLTRKSIKTFAEIIHIFSHRAATSIGGKADGG
jgi:hypothetical protein